MNTHDTIRDLSSIELEQVAGGYRPGAVVYCTAPSFQPRGSGGAMVSYCQWQDGVPTQVVAPVNPPDNPYGP